MIVALSGPSGVGKSFVVDRLVNEYGYSRIVPYTSRPSRPGERNGIDYWFCSESELRSVSGDFLTGYWARPIGHHWYGYVAEDLARADESNHVLQAYSDLVLQMKRERERLWAILLCYYSEQEMRRRIASRCSDTRELSDRLAHAERDLRKSDSFDAVSYADDPNRHVEFVLRNVPKQALP
jgi:guanylate kinase